VIGHDSTAVFARHKKIRFAPFVGDDGKRESKLFQYQVQDLSSDQTSVSNVFSFFFFALNSKK